MFLNPSLLVRAKNATFSAVAGSPLMLQPECQDINHCRTLQSIIYGSFSTVFLCTWTALHLNIRASLSDRVVWMIIALIAPEAVFVVAFDDLATSSDLLGKIIKNYPECGWTETHAQFVKMKGFRLVDANGKTFLDCVKDGTIDLPKVSKDEILGRSKGDLVAKGFAVIQTAWFVIQCIHHRSQHLLLAQLEITTLAHTLINLFIYFFWWHKPYEVAIPIEIPFKERRPETIGGRDDKVESKLKGSSSEGDDNTQTTEIEPTQPPPNDDVNTITEKDPPVTTKSSGDKSLVAATDKELKSDEANGNGTPSMSWSLHHSWYTRLGIKTFSLHDQAHLSIHGRIVLSVIYFIVGSSFGAMHCLAWNSAFPTRAEQCTWWVSSLIVTVIGSSALVYRINQEKADYFLDETSIVGFLVDVDTLVYIPLFIYYFARLFLFILAILQLRALPYAGYATPSWTIFYPHIG